MAHTARQHCSVPKCPEHHTIEGVSAKDVADALNKGWQCNVHRASATGDNNRTNNSPASPPESGSSDVQVASREAAEIIDRHFGHLYDSVHVRKAAAADIATTLRSRELAVRGETWRDAIQIAITTCRLKSDSMRLGAEEGEAPCYAEDIELCENLKSRLVVAMNAAKAQSFRKEGE